MPPASQPHPGDQADRPQASRLRIGDWLLTLLVFFVAGGDAAPHRNEAHYLCRLKHFWDPEWCQGDLFLESPDAHFTVVWLFGWVTLWLSLDATAWLGRFLSWALLAWGWNRLVWRIAPRPLLAPLGAALLVVVTELMHFAGEWVIGGFEAKTLAYGLVLLALRDALDDRWNRAWVLLGGASALHALVGGWSVVALLFSWAICRRRPSLPGMAPGLVVGGLLSLAGVLPALALNQGTPPAVVEEANQIYVYKRLAHHLAPLTKEPEWIARQAGAHSRLLLALAVLHAVLVPRMRESRLLQPILWWAWGAAALSATGIAIELIGKNDPAWAAGLLRYYFFRLSDIAAPIAAIAVLLALLNEAFDHRRPFAPLLTAALSLGCLLYLADYTRDRLAKPYAPADVKMIDQAAWVSMCEWVRDNTPEGTVVLTPRLSHTFKWRTGRAEVVTYKDVPQDAQTLVEWWRRYRDVYQVGEWPETGDPIWTPSLGALGATRLRQLANDYHARYALDQDSLTWTGDYRTRQVSLPIVHRVGPYTLYDLKPPAAADSKTPSQ